MKGRPPIEFSILDLVKLFFHSRRVGCIKYIVEAFKQKVVHRHPERRRMKTALDLFYIFAILDGSHDRGIGRRPSDTLFFESFNKRRLRIPRRGLGEMLFGCYGIQLQRLTLCHRRKASFFFAVVHLLRPLGLGCLLVHL